MKKETSSQSLRLLEVVGNMNSKKSKSKIKRDLGQKRKGADITKQDITNPEEMENENLVMSTLSKEDQYRQ